jgi:hypothetical protein
MESSWRPKLLAANQCHIFGDSSRIEQQHLCP